MMVPDKLSRRWIVSGIRVCLKSASLTWLLLCLAPVSFGQFKPCPPVAGHVDSANQFGVLNEEPKLASAIPALKRLNMQVLVYRSLSEFEESGALARVSFEHLNKQVHEVMIEVEPILAISPDSKLKREITNALYSYRDGVFWWSKINHPRVLSASDLSFREITRTPSDTAHEATIPYLVTIHWRHAHKHLERAQALAFDPRLRFCAQG